MCQREFIEKRELSDERSLGSIRRYCRMVCPELLGTAEVWRANLNGRSMQSPVGLKKN